MNPIAIPLLPPWSFWTVAVPVTAYHAYRAWCGKAQAVVDANVDRESNGLESWSRKQRILIHQIHDASFHVVCSMAGFLSLYALAWSFSRVVSFDELAVGAGVRMAFLAVFGVAGVAGVLPPIFLLFRGVLRGMLGQSN